MANITLTDMLAIYNQQHNTNFMSVEKLAVHLVNVTLKEAWITYKRNQAHELAAIEAEGI